VLRLELAHRDAGILVSAGQRREAVEAFEPGRVRVQTPHGRVRDVVSKIEELRPGALAALRGVGADRPVAEAHLDPAFDQAWDRAVTAFADECRPPRAT
jgi:hypothetical protein